MAAWGHLPLLLLAIDHALRDASPRRAALAAGAIVLLTASQLLHVHPQAVWMSLLVEASYTMLRLRRGALRRAARVTAAKLSGLVVAAVQWLPMAEAALGSTRRSVDPTFTAAYALDPLDALQFVGPYLFQARAVSGSASEADNLADVGWYAGCAVPVLALWVAVRWRALTAPPPMAVHGLRQGLGDGALIPDRVGRLLDALITRDRNPARFDALRRLWSIDRLSEVDPRHRETLPRVRLVARVRVVEDPTRIEGVDLETTALVDRWVEVVPGPPGEAEIVREEPGHIRVRTRARTAQMLVLSEGFHPGWQARVGGAAHAVVPVYGDFIGVPVPAGDRTVDLSFAPGSLWWGALVSALGVLVTLAWLICAGRSNGAPAAGEPVPARRPGIADSRFH